MLLSTRVLFGGYDANPMSEVFRQTTLCLGFLCLLVAAVHSLVWFAGITPQLYFVIPPVFFAFVGVVLIISSQKRKPEQDLDG